MFNEGGARFQVEKVLKEERKPILLSNQSRLGKRDEVTKLYKVSEGGEISSSSKSSCSSSSSTPPSEMLGIKKGCPCRPVSEFVLLGEGDEDDNLESITVAAVNIDIPTNEEVADGFPVLPGGLISEEGKDMEVVESSGRRRSSRRSSSSSGSRNGSDSGSDGRPSVSIDRSAIASPPPTEAIEETAASKSLPSTDKKNPQRRASSRNGRESSRSKAKRSGEDIMASPSPVASDPATEEAEAATDSPAYSSVEPPLPVTAVDEESNIHTFVSSDFRRKRKRFAPASQSPVPSNPQASLPVEKNAEHDGEEGLEMGEVIVLVSSVVDSSLPDIGDSLFQDNSLTEYSRRDSTNDSSRAVVAIQATDSPVASLSVKNVHSSSLSSSSQKRLLLSTPEIYAEQEE